MNVIVFASRKGGTGKSTLAAHLAAHLHKPSRPCLLVDGDPQGSLTLWHRLRETGEPPLRNGLRNLAGVIKNAKDEGFEWVLIDTPPNMSQAVLDAIKLATLVVVPARPGVFDLNAIRETIEASRRMRRAYAVILNGTPPKRMDQESPIVTSARESLASLDAPVWAGQITHRSAFSLALDQGEGAREFDADSYAAQEITKLAAAIDRSIKVIRGARGDDAMHKVAA
jgi:cellulose biosynthesis protein BcsQ